jgi:GDP-4-dehydro-6-deoxy-D-mannose reductase
MTVALVTGASGFVAQHLTPALRSKGYTKIIGADVRAIRPGAFDASFVADLSAKSEMQRVVEGSAPDIVFHLAGTAQGSEETIRASNLDTARYLIESVKETLAVTRIVLIGSAAEYGEVPSDRQPVDETFIGRPRGLYGSAKAAVAALVSRAATEDGVNAVVARPFNIIGPGIPSSLVVGAIVDRLRRALAGPAPRVISIGKTTSIRDFVAVEDVVDGLILVGERGAPGAAYNLCTGIGRSIADVLTSLIALTGEEIRVESDPSLIRDWETDALVGSWRKAQLELGWSPRILFDLSVRETWEASASTFAGSST